MAKEKDYKKQLKSIKIPLLVLDQKWHQLFRANGKPDKVVKKEEELNQAIQAQARLSQSLKDLKKLKNTLMDNIVQNMDGTSEEHLDDIMAKKLAADRKLIDEINEKMDNIEDQLIELPRKISTLNEDLMNMTMEYCYNSFRQNAKEIAEISKWIAEVRHDLKVNVVKKQNREINSRMMYAYMHDIFGAQVVDLFDLSNEDVNISLKNQTTSYGNENAQKLEKKHTNKNER